MPVAALKGKAVVSKNTNAMAYLQLTQDFINRSLQTLTLLCYKAKKQFHSYC